jgi:serine/threonine protein kinase
MTALAPQQRVGSFILLEKIGSGGLGEVWKARDHRLSRVVALKFILTGELRFPHDLAREARAASALNHPNIITILEIGESDNGAYIAMEFVEGETLRTRMDKARMPFSEVLDVVAQMARGLAAAHRSGIVHRDIKPENVMIRIDGYVKLVDFGLAKMLPWGESVTLKTSSDFTETGKIAGTFGYMSPEQARGQQVGPSSDIFSFGIVLYELLTGEHPFRADNPVDTLNRIINTEAPATRARRPEAPKEVHEIVARCLKKDKTHRPQSGAELEIMLRDMKREAPSKPQRKWHRAAAVVLIVLILGVLLWMWGPFSGVSPAPIAVRSVAVMNFSAPPEDPLSNILAQSLAEELGGALSSEGFLVPPRSRVAAIVGPVDARRIGSQLEVESVLEGSITNIGGTTRVHFELVDAKTGFLMSSGTLPIPSGDEVETAARIAQQLRRAAGGAR